MEAAKVLNDELPESETVSNKLQAEHNTIDTDFMRAHPLKVGKGFVTFVKRKESLHPFLHAPFKAESNC